MLGNRDSEVAVVITDTQFLNSTLNNQQVQAGSFSRSLRLALFSEHLGIPAEELSSVVDCVCDDVYKKVWQHVSSDNSLIYDRVFSCLPSDELTSLQQVSELRKQQQQEEEDELKGLNLGEKYLNEQLSMLKKRDLTPDCTNHPNALGHGELLLLLSSSSLFCCCCRCSAVVDDDVVVAAVVVVVVVVVVSTTKMLLLLLFVGLDVRRVRGHVVTWPTRFLYVEDLRPNMHEKEYWIKGDTFQ